jgi:NAD/NADP transhydrogenase alpha subunit
LAEPITLVSTKKICGVIKALDDKGRWINKFDGNRLVGQAKMPLGTPYLSSKTFSKNLTQLSNYLLQRQ